MVSPELTVKTCTKHSSDFCATFIYTNGEYGRCKDNKKTCKEMGCANRRFCESGTFKEDNKFAISCCDGDFMLLKVRCKF